jgi:hypothetical protein
MHHGGWRPDRTLRLGRRAKSDSRMIFCMLMTVDGPVGDLAENLIHHSYPDVHDVLEARPLLERQCRDMHSRGRTTSTGERSPTACSPSCARIC